MDVALSQELARSAPSLLYSRAAAAFELLWLPLCASDSAVRGAAAEVRPASLCFATLSSPLPPVTLAALKALPKRDAAMVPRAHQRPLLCVRLMQASPSRAAFVERHARLMGARSDRLQEIERAEADRGEQTETYGPN